MFSAVISISALLILIKVGHASFGCGNERQLTLPVLMNQRKYFCGHLRLIHSLKSLLVNNKKYHQTNLNNVPVAI